MKKSSFTSIVAASSASMYPVKLQWRHNGCDGVSNHQPHNCLLKRLFRRRSKETSKLCVTGLCAGNSPVSGLQMASNAENVSIWWRHPEVCAQLHVLTKLHYMIIFIDHRIDTSHSPVRYTRCPWVVWVLGRFRNLVWRYVLIVIHRN